MALKVQIRDLWDAPSGSLRTALSDLEATLGGSIRADCNWQAIIDDAPPNQDKESLVPSVVALVTGWSKVLGRRLEDDDGAAWVEALVDAVSKTHQLRVLVEVRVNNDGDVDLDSTDPAFESSRQKAQVRR